LSRAKKLFATVCCIIFPLGIGLLAGCEQGRPAANDYLDLVSAMCAKLVQCGAEASLSSCREGSLRSLRPASIASVKERVDACLTDLERLQCDSTLRGEFPLSCRGVLRLTSR
jgi:hypothetical protein